MRQTSYVIHISKKHNTMKKIIFILLGMSAFAVSSCDWWDYRDPWDPGDPPCDTIIDPWDPGDTNWWDPNDTIIIDPPPFDTSNGGGWRDTNGVYRHADGK